MYASEIARAAKLLATGHGPFAIDAERASGFRYSNRAYLVQIRRNGAGTVLIDPVGHGADPMATMAPVVEVLAEDEWVLHAADQDLPCLAELGMTPPALYDTELAGRLAGFDRVNLAAMVERLLGLQLTKGHGAADWSKRPLPPDWLNYAALDVEVLLELRTRDRGVTRGPGQDPLGRRGIRVPPHVRRTTHPARPVAAHVGHPQGARATRVGRRARTMDDAGPHRPTTRHRAGPDPARRRDHQRRDQRSGHSGEADGVADFRRIAPAPQCAGVAGRTGTGPHHRGSARYE